MNKHTQGPWVIDPASRNTAPEIIQAGTGRRVALALYAEGSENASEAEANGNLIAAAPEMLAALEKAAETLRANAHRFLLTGIKKYSGVADYCWEQEREIRALIAKATGANP